MSPLLTQRAAAAMLSLSERTLERLRLTGGGPAFVRLTRGRSQVLGEYRSKCFAKRLVHLATKLPS